MRCWPLRARSICCRWSSMIVTSFKPLAEIPLGNMLALPQEPPPIPGSPPGRRGAASALACDGHQRLLPELDQDGDAGASLISTLLGALNGFVLTKWRFPGHNLVFGLMLFACFIPFQVDHHPDGA